MKVFLINSSCNGSTGKIARSICSVLKESSNEYFFAHGIGHYDDPKSLSLSNWFESHLHDQLSKLTGMQGYFSIFRTIELVHKLKAEDPDIIHLHNLHGNYLCLPILFRYLKNSRAKIVLTMHDCWWFTGKCAHFTFVKCERWKTGCGNCPQWSVYPKSYFFDQSKRCLNDKKKWLTSIGDRLTIVTPSQWLANLVKQSFLKDYPVKVINNGIDLEVFKPTVSGFRAKYHLENKLVLLGVAFAWGERKGLDVFVELAKRLDDRFKIVLVGTNDKVDKQLPENIISIHKTNNQTELAEIYTAADLFVNPTREEVLGLVNIEALACGTPVITFKTGGSPECIDETCGRVVECDDLTALRNEIVRICETHPYSDTACQTRAKKFDAQSKFREYLNIYSKLIK
ncbi:glycosyltransferase [bacterium]|nr:glycosyltransferase [bacterium]